MTERSASVDGSSTSLIDSSNTNFSAISSQDANLEKALTLLPGDAAARRPRRSARCRPSPTRARRAAGAAAVRTRVRPGAQAAPPLFRDTTPVIRNQLRPFAVAVQPLAKILEPAQRALANPTPRPRHVRRAQRAVQHARLPAARQRAGLPVLGLVAQPHRDSLTSPRTRTVRSCAACSWRTCAALNLFEVALRRARPGARAAARPAERADWSKINSPFCPTAPALP